MYKKINIDQNKGLRILLLTILYLVIARIPKVIGEMNTIRT